MGVKRKLPRHRAVTGLAEFFPPSPGYPLWSCSSAEPHSVSPGTFQHSKFNVKDKEKR